MNATPESRIFDVAVEQTAPDLPIRGTLPDYVNGTIYLNGPARFTIGGKTRKHWLDGDGLVRALRVGEGKAAFSSRYVRTRRFVDESEADKWIYRGFGTAFPDDVLIDGRTLASPANVSAYPFGGKLLAFGEQSLPWLMDPSTLQTIGELPVDPALNRIGALSAHPKFIGDRMATFGVRFFGPRARLHYYEFDPGLKPVVSGSLVLPEPSVIHDFALTETHAIFHVSPYTLNARKLLKEGASLLEALHWDREGHAHLIVVDRADGAQICCHRLEDTQNSLHTINAWNEDGALIVDLIESPEPFYPEYVADPHMFGGLASCDWSRIRLDLENEAPPTQTRVRFEGHVDFPSVPNRLTGQRTDRFWCLGMPLERATPKFYDRLHVGTVVDGSSATETWQAPHGTHLGCEPVPIEDPADPSAITVAVHCFRPVEGTAGWLFFDGNAITAGPIARLDLPEFDPPGFHTTWHAG